MMPFASRFDKCLLHHSRNYYDAMDSPAERLRAAREKAGFASAKDAAEAMDVAVATYIQHENGTRGYPAKKAEMYARRYHVAAEWLLYGKGLPPKGPAVPSVEELTAMLESAQREIPTASSYGDWPRLAASTLRTQLERFLADRGSGGDPEKVTSPGKSARSPVPTKPNAQG